jgi:hypothetical protein
MPAWAGAAELDLSMNAGMEFDSDAVVGQGKQGPDFGFRLSPTLAFQHSLPRLDYRLYYQPTYVRYVNTQRDDDVDHLGSLRADYALGPRSQLSLDGRVSWIRSFVFESFQETRAGQIVTVADDTLSSDRIFRGEGSLLAQHSFSERLTGSSSVSYSNLQAQDPDQVDSQGGYSESELSYALGPSSAINWGGAFSYQAFQEVDATLPGPLPPPNESLVAVQQPSSQTYTYQGFGGFSRRFGRIWTFSLRGGPTYVVTREQGAIVARQTTPTTIDVLSVPSSVDGRWTLFGQARLSARWSETLRSSASYRRSQADTSGFSGASIRDAVSLFTSWQPGELWNLGLLGEWVQRTRANQNQRDAFESTRWSLTGNASRNLTRRASLALRVHLSTTDQTQRGQSSHLDEYLALLEFRYAFDPIRVWN